MFQDHGPKLLRGPLSSNILQIYDILLDGMFVLHVAMLPSDIVAQRYTEMGMLFREF